MELQHLVSELSRDDDRALAIVALAMIDEALSIRISVAMAVEAATVDTLLFKAGSGPLGTLSSRIDLLFCLGLLTEEERRNLHLMRKIRNEFAHDTASLSFQTPSVINRVGELRGPSTSTTSRDRFIDFCLRYILQLHQCEQGS